jgi:hypothetical protein
MNSPRLVSAALLAVALAAGTGDDAPRPNPPLTLGGYRVLAADFHVHEYPFSGSTLAPWDLVLEARRQGLDAIAITGHNYVLAGLVGRWFGRFAGGPIVLAGEEIHTPGYHLVAVGIHQTIGWRATAAHSIDQVHRQGGVAIAAHPLASSWPAYSAEAMRKLDGAEVMQPVVFQIPRGAEELRRFFARGHLTAVGSSDFHGMGPVGLCRTYVFAREASEQGILEALRQGHTVVYGNHGDAYGDAALIALAAQYGRLREHEPAAPRGGFLGWLSRICGVAGMLGLTVSEFRGRPRTAPATFTMSGRR